MVEQPAGDVARTPDGRYVVVRGRRWRASDPALPEDAATVLRRELMSARRAVGAALRADDPHAERAARDRVQAAKVALGERGTPWWEQSPDERRARWEPLVRALQPGPPTRADGLSPGSPSRT
ncbi:biopolymer transporter Tol [Cellulomonas sp. 179-A 9B4 NHS]|uniref:biopolymer transporter Tol n=1 Tax=Cellulomonas sp. 179-A 9B4 NHS TaxID=3142379 RepID=UPI0039A3DC4E